LNPFSESPPPTPECWRRQFDAVAGGVPNIERSATLGPFDFHFDLDTQSLKPFAPRTDLPLGHRKGEVAASFAALTGHAPTETSCHLRIEHQQHTRSATEGHQDVKALKDLEPEHL